MLHIQDSDQNTGGEYQNRAYNRKGSEGFVEDQNTYHKTGDRFCGAEDSGLLTADINGADLEQCQRTDADSQGKYNCDDPAGEGDGEG